MYIVGRVFYDGVSIGPEQRGEGWKIGRGRARGGKGMERGEGSSVRRQVLKQVVEGWDERTHVPRV